jgi:hypothetical protein
MDPIISRVSFVLGALQLELAKSGIPDLPGHDHNHGLVHLVGSDDPNKATTVATLGWCIDRLLFHGLLASLPTLGHYTHDPGDVTTSRANLADVLKLVDRMLEPHLEELLLQANQPTGELVLGGLSDFA